MLFILISLVYVILSLLLLWAPRWDWRRRGRDQTTKSCPRRPLRLSRLRQRQPSGPAGGVLVRDEVVTRRRSPFRPIKLYSTSSVKYVHIPSSSQLGKHDHLVSSLFAQIMKKFQVPPFGQHLTYKGRDLVDNEATLASLRISPGTTILLQVIIDSQTARRDFFSSRFCL